MGVGDDSREFKSRTTLSIPEHIDMQWNAAMSVYVNTVGIRRGEVVVVALECCFLGPSPNRGLVLLGRFGRHYYCLPMEVPNTFARQGINISCARPCAHLSSSSAYLILEPLPMSFSSLERAVKAYQQHMPATVGQPLNLTSLPVGESLFHQSPCSP